VPKVRPYTRPSPGLPAGAILTGGGCVPQSSQRRNRTIGRVAVTDASGASP